MGADINLTLAAKTAFPVIFNLKSPSAEEFISFANQPVLPCSIGFQTEFCAKKFGFEFLLMYIVLYE